MNYNVRSELSTIDVMTQAVLYLASARRMAATFESRGSFSPIDLEAMITMLTHFSACLIEQYREQRHPSSHGADVTAIS
jgi:hypothetical protein